jgi:hypothetical protein
MSSTHPFLNEDNATMLQRVLYKDIIRRYGGDLNEKQASRLIKTVTYWRGEVYRVQGNKPVDFLNKEVFRLVLNDYMSYLERAERSSSRSVVSDIEEGPGTETHVEQVEVIQDVTRMDVGSAFSALQAQRQEARQAKPVTKDFRLELQDEGTVSLDLFEKIKQEREAEVQRAEQLAAARAAEQSSTEIVTVRSSQSTSGQLSFASASDMFSSGNKRAQEEAENLFAERERQRLVARASSTETNTTLPMPPDMRAILLGNNQDINRSNPYETSSRKEPDTLANLPQAIITRQPDVVSYKENEINLFISSADRDWATVGAATQDSRYNFTILFDPASLPATRRGAPAAFSSQRLPTPGGLSNTIIDNLDPSANIYPTPTIANRFRNITRIEFVKAILPGEGLEVLLTKTALAAYSSSLNMNVLSFPYIQVRIPELDTSNYGTNQSINSSFALLQYDANWVNDTNNSSQRGYFAMIPKFLKSQKVYTPTPLATLQKLSFQFQRPDGSILSNIPDTLDISRIIPTNCIYNGTTGTICASGTPPTIYARDTSAGATGIETNGAAYYWIQTTAFFNQFLVTIGDRIAIKNISWDLLTQSTNPNNPTNSVYATGPTLLGQINDIVGVLQNTTGLLVVNVGVITGSGASAVMREGANSSGYANAIIVRGKFTDPTTGVFQAASPNGIADASSGFANSNPITSPSIFLASTTLTTGRLINLSHQTHIAMRVITRDVDSTGILRPDNL